MSWTKDQLIKFQNALGDKKSFKAEDTDFFKWLRTTNKLRSANFESKWIERYRDDTYQEQKDERDKLFNRTI
jgi:hypothetical protein